MYDVCEHLYSQEPNGVFVWVDAYPPHERTYSDFKWQVHHIGRGAR